LNLVIWVDDLHHSSYNLIEKKLESIILEIDQLKQKMKFTKKKYFVSKFLIKKQKDKKMSHICLSLESCDKYKSEMRERSLINFTIFIGFVILFFSKLALGDIIRNFSFKVIAMNCFKLVSDGASYHFMLLNSCFSFK